VQGGELRGWRERVGVVKAVWFLFAQMVNLATGKPI